MTNHSDENNIAVTLENCGEKLPNGADLVTKMTLKEMIHGNESDDVCKACGGSGVPTSGKPCVPCQHRQARRAGQQAIKKPIPAERDDESIHASSRNNNPGIVLPGKHDIILFEEDVNRVYHDILKAEGKLIQEIETKFNVEPGEITEGWIFMDVDRNSMLLKVTKEHNFLLKLDSDGTWSFLEQDIA